MPAERTDLWADWLLHRRSGGDAALAQQQQKMLAPVRDRVLANAAIREGDTLLDVGCGDGLIAFGALDKVGATGCVIFSDISAPLLGHCRALAAEAGVTSRCRFVEAGAGDLSLIAGASVDVVTTRSVLIFLEDKLAALREFHRVLRPGGRISLFEPVNSYNARWESPDWLWGLDVTAVRPLADRVRAAFEDARRAFQTAMTFDDRDLLQWAEDAGFTFVRMTLERTVTAAGAPPVGPRPTFDAWWTSSPNPLSPSLAEAVARALGDGDDARRFRDHMRTRFEEGRWQRGEHAAAYLQATKVADGSH